ncbi:Ankyrin repeat-containing-like protein [Melia azedarach]|uniref:Ankyrin repeat-containing-like protein n=2 Tax=Melia azedarach TaxID=155640 RepID=A0ACC1Y0Z4_MELAZ|nr:Ankyrin repeat-containing-like protein [Melia azedarach]KAJ4717372.1 Ankyrin repeat-containing-like protein [Melia azedarach]
METTSQETLRIQEDNFLLMASLHNAAVEGNIEEFKKQGNIILDQVLTLKGNTTLHIHITARPKPAKPRNNILTKMGLTKKSEEVVPGTNFVEDVLEMRPVLLWKANTKGETPLHMAARHGHGDIVKVLIAECKKPHQNDHPEEGIAATRRMLGMTNETKDTALHEAVRYNQVNVVEILSREDPELPYDANNAGETPLYLAAERGYNDVVEHILLTCKSPADHGPMGRTALHAAVFGKHREMTKMLLEYKGSLTSRADEQGWLPLHLAACLGYYHIVKELLNADKPAAYKADNEGMTALHVAAAYNEIVVMKELIDSCPGCWELVDNEGRNVFHFALDSKNKSAVQLLLDNPSLGNLVNEKDNQGNTPLLHLAASDHYMRSFVCHPKVDKLVFDHQNRNAADIILRSYFLLYEPWSFLNCFRRIRGKNGQRHIVNYRSNDRKEKKKLRDEMIEKYIKESQNSHLVVAVLIATVTFTAGITLPGGYIGEKGPDQGTSMLVLTRNKAFQAFVILNTIAMILSSCGVFLHLFVRIIERKRTELTLWRVGLLFISYAMAAMVLAFLMGMYAVLYRARELTISACAIGGLFCFVLICTDPSCGLSTMMGLWEGMVFTLRINLRSEFGGFLLRLRIWAKEQHFFLFRRGT